MRYLIVIFLLCALCAFLNLLKSSESEHDLQTLPQEMSEPVYQMLDTVVSDSAMPQAQLPVLKIGGTENVLVYLQSLSIQVEVTGNIASTRYTMVFKNKTDRILEGELTFPLPDGRSVTHYALDINGKMREAVPVEKAKGTMVFEEIQRRRVDPGLLERVEGNNMRTRIYPIPANGTRTVSIGYEEELSLEKGLLYYRLPMAYQDSLENFAVSATVWKGGHKPFVPKSDGGITFDLAGENYVASLNKKNYRPESALVFALPAPPDIPQVIMQSAHGSHYFIASVAPKMETREKQWSDELAIIWDVSLSGSQRNLQSEMNALDIVFAQVVNTNVHLYFLNNKISYKGKYEVKSGKWDGLKGVLNAAIYDGGTDFSQINLNNIFGKEILFFSDGLSTLSDADFLKEIKKERPVHSIVSSAKADYSVMKLIAGKTKGKFININALSPEKLENELQNETMQFLGTEHGKTVREVYPSIAAPVYGNFSVAGISDADDGEVDLLFGFVDKVEKRIKARLNAKSTANQGNVYKIWAQKKIAELDLSYENNRAELMALGQQFGIVTRNTSLIVLETISDYVLYGIEPPASEPELRAEYQLREKNGARLANLGTAHNLTGNEDLSKAVEAVLERAGGLRTTGKTELVGRRASAGGGFNDGYAEGGSGGIGDMLGGLMGGSSGGIGTKSKGTMKAPSTRDIDMGSGYGARSKAEIMQVVNARMPGLRNIYNKYLKLRPGFNGKVMLKFTIAPSGDVIDIAIVSSTTGYPDFDNAVKNMVANWKWKAINSGNTTPTVPFNFNDGGNSAKVARSPAPVAPPPAMQPILKDVEPTQPGMLNAAIAAIETLKQWWKTDFKPATLTAQANKYPAPDVKTDTSSAEKPSYLTSLTGKAAEDYKIYLKLRSEHSSAPAFYFDMASWFYALGDKETALRVLTSIADLELENASLYRLLGYRFKEYGEYALEKFVCQKVVQWRPMEPQSYRDYALALADNGEAQAALDSLNSLLAKTYSSEISKRSNGIAEVVATEINHLIAKNPKLNTSKTDKRLLAKIPVDVRVVINWNMDNTDIDLHVKDPTGEECYYGRRQTNIGGRMSKDVTSGYGPEQFMLKTATKGKYQIYVNYFGDRQFTAAGPSTIMAEIYTKYADKTEQRQVVSLQKSNAKKRTDNKVEVAEFSF